MPTTELNHLEMDVWKAIGALYEEWAPHFPRSNSAHITPERIQEKMTIKDCPLSDIEKACHTLVSLNLILFFHSEYVLTEMGIHRYQSAKPSDGFFIASVFGE